MNLRSLSANQLLKILRKFHKRDPRPAAQEWARRIESGPKKSCIPKAKLRRAGLIPKVGDLVQVKSPKSKEEFPGLIVSDGESYFMITRPIETGEEIGGEAINNDLQNKWWAVRYPDGKVRIPIVLYPENTFKWYRRAKHANQTVEGKSLNPTASAI